MEPLWRHAVDREPMIVGESIDMKLKFVDRESTIEIIAKEIQAHWIRGEIPGNDLSDKSSNHLIGIHAVSGGGKSYMIDELLRLDWLDGKSIPQVYFS